MPRTVILAVSLLLACAASAHAGSAPYSAPYAPARAVALSDATHAPRVARVLLPGASVTYTRACPHTGYVTESSAYLANGRAMGAQRWTRNRTLTYWTHPKHGRVTFDGLTFTNRTRARVIVAGWCS